MESPMTKTKIFATAAVLASALAGPAMAQEVIYNPGYCAQFYPNANCQNLGPGNPYTDGGYYRSGWQNSNASIEHHRKRHHEAHRR
jgi:opacity protein-like surface antigen